MPCMPTCSICAANILSYMHIYAVYVLHQLCVKSQTIMPSTPVTLDMFCSFSGFILGNH